MLNVQDLVDTFQQSTMDYVLWTAIIRSADPVVFVSPCHFLLVLQACRLQVRYVGCSLQSAFFARFLFPSFSR